MTVARCGTDRAEQRATVLVENIADRWLLTDLGHLALTLDGRIRHQRLDAKLPQRFGHFLHFGGTALAMDGHAFQIVRDDLCPIEAGVIIAHRYGDFTDYAGARSGEETLQRQRFDALDHHAANHFDRRCRADPGPRCTLR